ncbi:MAG: LEPR-XLL domain-containing protein, partial [Planctomycetota bacterium]
MANGHSRGKLRDMLKRRKRKQNAAQRKSLQMEQLEDKVLLAADPRLISINANSGEVIQEGSVLNIAPRDLTFRFDDNQFIDVDSLGAIQILDAATSESVNVGFIGLGANENEVVARFADTLEDGTYEIVVGSGLRNTDGNPFGGSINSSGTTFSLSFRLDLGAQIKSIVPQPITRDAAGDLEQAGNQIDVYFNNDDLMPGLASAENPNFYQLIFTNDTATNTDDVIYRPNVVDYDATTDKATLRFAADLEDLGSGAGTFRLRIGDSNPLPLAPFATTPDIDAGDTFDTALELGVVGSRSQIISARIDPFPVNITLPGSNEDP